jgi:alpha-L-fucosidase
MSQLPGLIIVLLIFICTSGTNCNPKKYDPTWESIDSRPLPDWYDNVKVGIFIHWGIFSVPAFRSEWFWYYLRNNRETDCVQFMQNNFKPNFTYPEFAPMFTARHFDPDYWASVFQSSGAKYIVLTSKHHEGYTLWPSKTSWNWNSMDIGPKRDLVGKIM